jgi:hypothetical protein
MTVGASMYAALAVGLATKFEPVINREGARLG